MKTLAVLLTGLLLATNSFAATVVIDFQEVALGTSGTITSKGFSFSGGMGSNPAVILEDSRWTNQVLRSCYDLPTCMYEAGDPDPPFIQQPIPGFEPYIQFSKQDSSLFDLNSFQMASLACCGLPASVIGYFADGSSIQKSFYMGEVNWATISLGPEWTNLKSVRILGASYNYDFPIYEMWLDNVTVSTVPIPAAVWLFASGLGLLAWLRRRHTVN